MQIEERCFKFKIEDGPIVDITPDVISKALPYLQKNISDNEACGYIVGFKNINTKNITLNNISLPNLGDIRTRFFCTLKAIAHKIFLKNQERNENFYMGSWHTHPQKSPNPSTTDLNEWYETLNKDKTGCDYAFFIIFGTEQFGVWCGSFKDNTIRKLKELDRTNDLYVKE